METWYYEVVSIDGDYVNLKRTDIDSDDFNFLSCLPPVAWSGEHPDTAIPTAVSTFKV